MKTKELYKINVWGKSNFALLLPYEVEQLKYQIKNQHKKNKILSVRLVDGTLIPSDAIENIFNAKELPLLILIKELSIYFPNKINSLIIEKNGNILDPNKKMLGVSKIENHDILYNYLFGNKLFVYEKTVKVKAKINATLEAEIEVPDGCNILDYSDYIKNNKDFFNVSNVDYTVENIEMLI